MRNFIVTIDGKSYSVGVEEVESGVTPAPVQMAQTASASVKPAAPAAVPEGEKVLSPFPGIIKNLLVENGAKVKKNQPVIVMEAMKMDNDITAPCDGTVTFAVIKGANVETGTVLAVIS